VALLSPYQPPPLTLERQAAIDHAIEVMAQGYPGTRPCELSRAMKCTSDDGQLGYQHPRLARL
jgi:hypothetical protein